MMRGHVTAEKDVDRFGERLRRGALLGLVVLLALSGSAAGAEDDEDDEEGAAAAEERSWLQQPDWVVGEMIAGRYVSTFDGSESKFLEDHNIQSGPIFRVGVDHEPFEDSTLFLDGQVEPLQKEGYLLFEFEQAETFTFSTDIQAWREYYNTRTGEADETVVGTPISPTGIFPNTNRSTHFFGGGKPKTDWLRTRTGVDIALPGPFHDAYADFLYRRVKGEMSLLKGGTVFDPNAVPPSVVAGSGPGTVFFDVSGRQDVDYESIGAATGTRSALGDFNWQVDLRGMSHDFKAKAREPNLDTDFANSTQQTFDEDTTVDNVVGDFVASRNLRPDVFVFGGASASWERSEPDPSQFVQTGIRPASAIVRTRETLDANVIRYSQAVTGGAVFTPVSSVLVRADGSVRASQSQGRLNEDRDEVGFLTGDIGEVRNDSKRNVVSARARVKADWRATRRFSLGGIAQFDYRHDNVRSRRVLDFVVAEPDEIEDYTTDRSQFTAGIDGRYRFTKGRSIEGGYEFTWVGFENETNTLLNQFLVSDYHRFRHRFHLKASGRITRKLRGELRAQYIFEERDLDGPETQPPDIATEGNGEIQYQGFTFVPVLIYQMNPQWSGTLSVSIGRQQYKLVGDGPAPPFFSSRFSSFEYDAITETATLGVNWVPNDMMSYALGYSIYHNSQNVDNAGHDASIRSTFAITEHWDMDGAVRYLAYQPQHDNVDDYQTIILTLGLTGRF